MNDAFLTLNERNASFIALAGALRTPGEVDLRYIVMPMLAPKQ